MITITGLSKHYGGQILFDDVHLQLHAGSRYGIVGANGAGKSTLLRILAGEESASGGDVQMPRRAHVGVLSQDHFAYEDVPILDVVMMGRRALWADMQRKDQMLAAAEAGLPFDADLFGELEDRILREGGYELEANAAEVLEGLNIPTAKHRQPLRVLSGGYKLRALLGQVLVSRPDILLLDEPTNHLDILSVAWLERFLAEYKGCAVVVSHDHRFLDNVCTHILDVDYEVVTQYKGNYSAFTKAKVEERARREAEIQKRQEEIEDQKAFIARFKATASKARQANSRAKQVARIEIDTLPVSSRRHPLFRFPIRRPSGRDVVEVKGIWKAYGDNVVLSEVGFQVRRGERVAIIGPNGIGKSTLLKVLMGKVEPDAGEVKWGYETWPGYFAQDHAEVLDRPEATLKSWLWDKVPGQSVGFVHGKLAEVLFDVEEIEKKIQNLSGGEAARLVFATLGVLGPNVLVLDEPTNHLDLEGIESLAESIEKTEATVIFVSHDRWFVQRLATRIIDITENGVVDFEGSYDEHLARSQADRLDAEAAIAAERARKKDEKKDQKELAREAERARKEAQKEAQREAQRAGKPAAAPAPEDEPVLHWSEYAARAKGKKEAPPAPAPAPAQAKGGKGKR